MLFGLVGIACSTTTIPFASFQQELFDITPVTVSKEKVIRLANPDTEAAQHIAAIAFDAGANGGGSFQIKSVLVASREVGAKDVVVPGGSAVEIHVAYVPKNLATTVADFGGWSTGQPTRYTPQPPDKSLTTRRRSPATAILALLAQPVPVKAIHRALLLVTYDQPREGVTQIELVGRAVPGPNGETVATGGGGGTTTPGECTPDGKTACFQGQFGIELPGLMKGGPVFAEMSGGMPITIDGASAQVDLNAFPPVLFVVKGNGPGEPLDGKPVGAISIVISGVPDLVASGSFDGSALQLSDMGFRIRIYLFELMLEEADATTATADFIVGGLTVTTAAPLADGKITLHIETTLGTNPSNNPIVDPFLSGAKVIVTMDGALQLP